MIWNGKQLEKALSIKVDHNLRIGRVQFNSKDLIEGELFIAINGGEAYIEDAIKKGAAAIIANYETESTYERLIKVPNTTEALMQLARYKRNISQAKFIGITGSSGKTSVKEALKLLLEKFGQCFASRGNFNNHLGVPINLASMPDSTQYAVLELGMNNAGEISQLTKMVKPDIAVITSISEAHLEFFNSTIDIVNAKCEIFQGLKEEGIAIVNRDCSYYRYILDNLKNRNIHNICTFGESEEANSRLIYYNLAKNTSLSYIIDYSRIDLIVPNLLPKHQAMNFAACLAVASNLRLDLDKASNSLRYFNPRDGRGEILQRNKGNNRFEIICDYYNANPASVRAALQYLKIIDHQKKVIILGDMLELGTDSLRFHQDLHPVLIDIMATKILLVGNNVKIIADLLPKNCYVRSFINVEELMVELFDILEDGELILIKGSRSIGLDKIMQYFDQAVKG